MSLTADSNETKAERGWRESFILAAFFLICFVIGMTSWIMTATFALGVACGAAMLWKPKRKTAGR